MSGVIGHTRKRVGSQSTPLMDAKTLKALRGSIKKWEGIVAGTMEDYGEDNCPLCKLFLKQNCEGCPVYARTHHEGCYETPYRETLKADGKEEYDRLAQAELDFLKSLLPTDAIPDETNLTTGEQR